MIGRGDGVSSYGSLGKSHAVRNPQCFRDIEDSIFCISTVITNAGGGGHVLNCKRVADTKSRNNSFTNAGLGHIWSKRNNVPGDLMPQCYRSLPKKHIILSRNYIAIRMAQAGGLDLNKHLALPWGRNGNVFELESFGNIGKLKGSHHIVRWG